MGIINNVGGKDEEHKTTSHGANISNIISFSTPGETSIHNTSDSTFPLWKDKDSTSDDGGKKIYKNKYNRNNSFWEFEQQNKKREADLQFALNQGDIGNIPYTLLRELLQQQILQDFKNPHRKIFYKKVEKKVPIIKIIDVENKKVDEFGPILPILEEKQVNNPDEKNIKIHRIPATKKIISYKIIEIDEELPPQPLGIDINIPIGMYVYHYIESQDSLYDGKKAIESIKLLFASVALIQKQLKENIPIRIHITANDPIDRTKQLTEAEKKQRGESIFQWIIQTCKKDNNLIIEHDTNEKYEGGQEFTLYYNTFPSLNDNSHHKRLYNILVHKLKKHASYFSTYEVQTSKIAIDKDITELQGVIYSDVKYYLDGLFNL